MTSGDPHNPSEPVAPGPGDPHAPAPSEHVTADPGHGHAHGHDAGGEQTYFPPEHWQELRNIDKTAAAYIVVLMQGIFMIGLVLYLIVLWSVL
jgi:hypothetical protein